MKRFLKAFSVPLSILIIVISSCTSKGKEPTVTPKEDKVPPENTLRTTARGGDDTLVTTIAKINELTSGDIEILFNERQARYVIPRNNPRFDVTVRLAREALAGKKPVKLFSAPGTNIPQLTWPSAAETAAYAEWYRKNIIDVDKPRPINLRQIDTATFNFEINQPWKVFRVCTSIIPDIAIARTIFNFCKQQMCIIGPTQITPCIPFSYVPDGCFARAHKMRYIIETRYRYCSEKVFSFGNLDVKADLWGGCCIGWWYHVAPLVRVKRGKAVICYVIDPSMFTEPVTLSTWLAAQGNTTCDASSNVESYSIQPSSAYTPSGYPPTTTYSTDANYSQTNNDLIFYASQGASCN